MAGAVATDSHPGLLMPKGGQRRARVAPNKPSAAAAAATGLPALPPPLPCAAVCTLGPCLCQSAGPLACVVAFVIIILLL